MTSKRQTKKTPLHSNKCPWCGSRSYKDADKLNIIEKLRYIGCKVWICLRCNKKWAG